MVLFQVSQSESKFLVEKVQNDRGKEGKSHSTERESLLYLGTIHSLALGSSLNLVHLRGPTALAQTLSLPPYLPLRFPPFPNGRVIGLAPVCWEDDDVEKVLTVHTPRRLPRAPLRRPTSIQSLLYFPLGSWDHRKCWTGGAELMALLEKEGGSKYRRRVTLFSKCDKRKQTALFPFRRRRLKGRRGAAAVVVVMRRVISDNKRLSLSLSLSRMRQKSFRTLSPCHSCSYPHITELSLSLSLFRISHSLSATSQVMNPNAPTRRPLCEQQSYKCKWGVYIRIPCKLSR